MPTKSYTIFAMDGEREVSRVVYCNSIKNTWIEFFKLLKYTNIRVEEKELTY